MCVTGCNYFLIFLIFFFKSTPAVWMLSMSLSFVVFHSFWNHDTAGKRSGKKSKNKLTSASRGNHSTLLVQSVELSADCRLKSLIRSDWSRLSKSARSSWSICIEEGQTSARRRSTHSKYIWMFVWISRQYTHSTLPHLPPLLNLSPMSFHSHFTISLWHLLPASYSQYT